MPLTNSESDLPSSLTEAGHVLLRSVFVGAHLRWNSGLIDGALVVVLGVVRVDHLGGLTTSRTETGHTLLGS